MPFTYEFPRPSVTLDAAVVTVSKGHLEILLIKRNNEPFAGSFALPGGFLEMSEEPLEGAKRELFEETGIQPHELNPLFACGQTGRDPRGRSITLVFGTLVKKDLFRPRGGDDASEAAWMKLLNPPRMAFDHERILREVFSSLSWQAITSVVGRNFLPTEFTEDDLVSLHRAIHADSVTISPLERGRRLGIIREGSRPGLWSFDFSFPDQPDFIPFPW